jgi:hypothetical protein
MVLRVKEPTEVVVVSSKGAGVLRCDLGLFEQANHFYIANHLFRGEPLLGVSLHRCTDFERETAEGDAFYNCDSLHRIGGLQNSIG